MEFVFEKCKFVFSWFCYFFHGEGDWKGMTCAFLLLIAEKIAWLPLPWGPKVTHYNWPECPIIQRGNFQVTVNTFLFFYLFFSPPFHQACSILAGCIFHVKHQHYLNIQGWLWLHDRALTCENKSKTTQRVSWFKVACFRICFSISK